MVKNDGGTKMKKIIFLISIVTAFFCQSCNDKGTLIFDTPINNEMFRFTPIEGGAVLHYKITDPQIKRVKVEYLDEFGAPSYKSGDFSVDTLLLDGFNASLTDVPAKISFMDRFDKESMSINLTFNTLPSNLHTFFDNVKVSPYWQGFQVTYDLKGFVKGSATIYFVGTNPNTQALDTLTLETFQLEIGRFTKAYTLDESQQQEDYTVVITTEDNKQRIAKKQVWTNVVGIEREMLPNDEFELLDPFYKSKEIPYNSFNSYNPGALSKDYLFDGDIKGTKATEYFSAGRATPPFTFLAGPNALTTNNNNVYFVLDIKEPSMVGEVRFYSKYGDNYAVNYDFDNDYYTKLPCDIRIYAWTPQEPYDSSVDQSSIPESNWKFMGSFIQDPSVEVSDRWYYNKERQDVVKVSTMSDLEPLTPLYVSVPFEFDEHKYRYFKIEFGATYKSIVAPDYYHNNGNNVTFHEIEVYAKKETE